MLSSDFLDPQSLLENIFWELGAKYNTQEIQLARPIRTRVMANNPQHTVEKQFMEYDRFLYLRLARKLWILCLGKHQITDGEHYIADLSALRIFDLKLAPAETVAEIKARLRSSRTFHHSLLCGRTDSVLCFPMESMHYEAMQASSDVDPNSFWVAPRHRDLCFGDGQFRDPHLQAGFYQAAALGHFTDLVVNVLTMPD